MQSFRLSLSLSALAILAGGVHPLAGQSGVERAARFTRPQIETAIAEADKILSSPGYSGRIKQSKRREIALLRARLSEGDLQPGDQIVLSVQGENDLTGTFLVSAGRFITLPRIADVSLRGVLRSEVEEYLTRELRRYLNDPILHVRITIRVSVLGAVSRPGFYQVPSETMIGDAIMLAGGPAGGVDPAKTRVQRSGTEILSQEDFAQALSEGRTLDQMNLLAGDEILVGGARALAQPGRSTLLNVALPVMSGLLGLGYMLSQIF